MNAPKRFAIALALAVFAVMVAGGPTSAESITVNGKVVDLVNYLSNGAVSGNPRGDVFFSKRLPHPMASANASSGQDGGPVMLPGPPSPGGAAFFANPMMLAGGMHGCGPLAVVTSSGSVYLITTKKFHNQPILCMNVGKDVKVGGTVYKRSGFEMLVADTIEMGL